jgi:hypothetical protein
MYTTGCAPHRPFQVYAELFYDGNIPVSWPKPIILYANDLLTDGNIDYQKVTSAAQKSLAINQRLVIIDLEIWIGPTWHPEELQSGIDKALGLIAALRQIVGDKKDLGWFGCPPVIEGYYPVLRGVRNGTITDIKQTVWWECCLRLRPVADALDVICIDSYAWFYQPNDWIGTNTLMLEAAKLYEKPILPFICPRYWMWASADAIDYTYEPNIAFTYLSEDYWQTILTFFRSRVQGVIIYGGFNGSGIWPYVDPWTQRDDLWAQALLKIAK